MKHNHDHADRKSSTAGRTMTRKPEIIIIRETLFQSVMRDSYTFVVTAGLIGLGVWIESSAMQWFGGIMALSVLLAKGAALSGKNRYSIEQARKRLDELEVEQ